MQMMEYTMDYTMEYTMEYTTQYTMEYTMQYTKETYTKIKLLIIRKGNYTNKRLCGT